MEKFESETQKDQPWNAIGAVKTSGTSNHQATKDHDDAQTTGDSDRATRGS